VTSAGDTRPAVEVADLAVPAGDGGGDEVERGRVGVVRAAALKMNQPGGSQVIGVTVDVALNLAEVGDQVGVAPSRSPAVRPGVEVAGVTTSPQHAVDLR
jgi:hypothetical protein